MKRISDLEKMEISLKKKTEKIVTRKEFEEIKETIKTLITKIKTRNF